MPRAVQIALLLTIVVGIVGGMHYYFWVRLVRDPGMTGAWRVAATAAIVALAVFVPASLVGARLLPREVVPFLAWPAFIWMGAAFILLCVLAASDLVQLLAGFADRGGGGGGGGDPARRLFFARVAASVTGATAAGLSVWAARSALGGPKLVELDVPIARLPPAADGLRIVQLTDVHVGPTLGREFMEDLVARVNALAPDIVAITGDLVDGSVADLGAAVAPLAELRARHGVYFVTGNHEYYSGAGEWVRFLPTLGIRVLRNERVTIGSGAAAFDLAGVDDWKAFGRGHKADLAAALAGRDDSRALVLLAHQPRQIAEAARAGVDLQLSGHTHGGQIWPFTYLVYLQQPYVAGLSRHKKTWIYVSRGTGYWGPPMRLAAPSEITILRLRSGAGDSLAG